MKEERREKRAVIVGAGPAGLTAAYELLKRTGIKPLVFEMSRDIGGISKTVNYKGNRIDIGGHRFFSKSDRVMDWWQEILGVQGSPSKDDIELGRSIPLSKEAKAPDPEKTDLVLLIRERVSRIFFLRKFFDYPVSLSAGTLTNLGIIRTIKITLSYARARISPIKTERSLEDFFINRFGRELYLTFFKDYTEKVWGVPCREIRPEWGAQRIKGLSISKAVLHALKGKPKADEGVRQKGVETSLIGQFLYPKFGPGQMWEEAAFHVRSMGGLVELEKRVTAVQLKEGRAVSVEVTDHNGIKTKYETDYLFSTMPVKELIAAINTGAGGSPPPAEVQEVAKGLVYRDFITIGLLVKRLKIKNKSRIKTLRGIVPDNWIYVQERDVKLGRIQIFNNWSPYMVTDDETVWMGLEYFCNEGDKLWLTDDTKLERFAAEEMAKIGIIERADVLDSTVIRVPKTYPAYFGTYDRFDVIRDYTDQIENLFLIGRNGMHRYNNQDHSMLAAMTAVDNIISGRTDKDNIWAVNTEEEYHETKDSSNKEEV